MVGYAHYYVGLDSVDTSFMITNFTSTILLFDGSNASVLDAKQAVYWSSPSRNWPESGEMSFESYFNIPDWTKLTLSSFFLYAHDAFTFVIKKSTCKGEKDSCEETWMDFHGSGNYGGSSTDWHAALVDAILETNEGLVGSVSMQIKGDIPLSLPSGDIIVSAQVRDNKDAIALTSFGTASWMSPSEDWLTDGRFSVISLLDISDGPLFNSSLLFSFNDTSFSVAMRETTTHNESDTDALYVKMTGRYQYQTIRQW